MQKRGASQCKMGGLSLILPENLIPETPESAVAQEERSAVRSKKHFGKKSQN